MINYEKELNEEQLRVVLEADGPLLVIAGAGSGKTRALTYRVARLIELNTDPDRILLATFTNKASRAMLSRVKQLVGQDTETVWGGTFHRIANLILRKTAHLLGYEKNFSIIDAEDSSQLINTCIQEKNIDVKGIKFPKGDVLREIASLGVNMGKSIEQVVAWKHPDFQLFIDDVKAILELYRSRKLALNVMDFDDLLLNLKTVLCEFPQIKQAYSERFQHILVDEYQDTNKIQADIIDLLASCHKNLMVVGDDSQSIYAFRGANLENIIEFPKRYPKCKIFKLETNYRSTPEILNMANLSIENNERQFHKTLRAIREQGMRPVLVPVENTSQQANFVVQRVIELFQEGVSLNEIAILYRAHFHSMELQMEMTRRGIPFEIRSGLRFFEQAHIKDVAAYLRILENSHDELAWMRALRLYNRIGKATARKIWKYLSSHGSPLDALFKDDFIKCAPKSSLQGMIKFQALMKNLLLSEASAGAIRLIEILLENGYRDYLLQNYTDAVSREDDIKQFAMFSSKFESLGDFLREVVLLTNMAEGGEEDSDAISRGRVVLSTIHQAKGLEWSVVIILGCADGMLPLSRAVKEPDGEAEERRLFYVAITRAKDHLYLCYPLFDYSRAMGSMSLRPSRFIRELSRSGGIARARPYDEWMVNERFDY